MFPLARLGGDISGEQYMRIVMVPTETFSHSIHVCSVCTVYIIQQGFPLTLKIQLIWALISKGI